MQSSLVTRMLGVATNSLAANTFRKHFGLEKEDALNRVRWRVGVGETAVRVG